MKKFLLILDLLFIALISLSFPSHTKAALIFSDSFQGGYDKSWFIDTSSASPVISKFGITGENSTSWSVIQHSINGNNVYIIELDIQVNNDSSNHAWGIGIGDNSNNWKIINTWQSSLQLHDSNGNDKIISWNHAVGKHHFSITISPTYNTPLIIKEDDQLLASLLTTSNFEISRFWVSIQGNGDYEMANFSLSTYEEPTPTPTPEPTLTPTPSPTITPTPTSTPTPIPTQPKKIIFLHGMGGSWNTDAILNCKSSGYTGTWSPWVFKNLNIYTSLIDSLTTNGYEVIPYYYDWRKTTIDIAEKLTQFIQSHTTPNETFYLIGHSFGGLVGRAYLGSTKENSHVDKFLTIGSPHLGSVLAYPTWSGGEMWINDTAMRLGFVLMQASCTSKKSRTPRTTIQTFLPSIQNLLPIFDYLTDSTGQTKPVNTMIAKNNWLPDTFTPPYYGIHIGTITGTGYDTLHTIQVAPPSRIDKRLGNWQDGKPTGNQTYADGDGTVLSQSTQLPDVPNISLPLDHAGLVTQSAGIAAILRFLNDSPELQSLRSMQATPQHTISSKGATVLFVAAEGARFTLTDKDGNTTWDSKGQITILDPTEEAYTLDIAPAKKWWWHKTKIMVVQLFEDGTSTWKEYTHPGPSHRHWKLRFNRHHKHNDILKDR